MADREIHLIRHLPTVMNKSGEYMGRNSDPGILQDGISAFLKDLERMRGHVDLSSPVFYSSPALRCMQTIELFKKVLGLESDETFLDSGLLETDFGDASGLTAMEIKDKFPDVYRAWITDQSRTRFPNGESYQEVQTRAWTTLQDILERSGDASSIIICSHVDVIKMLIFKVVDIPISSKPLVVIPNGSVCTLAISKSGLKLKLG